MMSDAPAMIYLSPNPNFENKWSNPLVVDPFEDEDIFEYRLTDLAPATAQLKAHPTVKALVEALNRALAEPSKDVSALWVPDARASLAALEDKP